jgi:hypothetical protein
MKVTTTLAGTCWGDVGSVEGGVRVSEERRVAWENNRARDLGDAQQGRAKRQHHSMKLGWQSHVP